MAASKCGVVILAAAAAVIMHRRSKTFAFCPNSAGQLAANWAGAFIVMRFPFFMANSIQPFDHGADVFNGNRSHLVPEATGGFLSHGSAHGAANAVTNVHKAISN